MGGEEECIQNFDGEPLRTRALRDREWDERITLWWSLVKCVGK